MFWGVEAEQVTPFLTLRTSPLEHDPYLQDVGHAVPQPTVLETSFHSGLTWLMSQAPRAH